MGQQYIIWLTHDYPMSYISHFIINHILTPWANDDNSHYFHGIGEHDEPHIYRYLIITYNNIIALYD
jgi:hypothetical protein